MRKNQGVPGGQTTASSQGRSQPQKPKGVPVVLLAGFSFKAAQRIPTNSFGGHKVRAEHSLTKAFHALHDEQCKVVIANADVFGDNDIIAMSKRQPGASIIAVHGDKSRRAPIGDKNITTTPIKDVATHIAKVMTSSTSTAHA